jgi:hypothetical protein
VVLNIAAVGTLCTIIHSGYVHPQLDLSIRHSGIMCFDMIGIQAHVFDNVFRVMPQIVQKRMTIWEQARNGVRTIY